MHTSLVTGGAGFIGSHLARELLNKGHQVIVIDDLSGGFRENLPAECRFFKGSIVNDALISKIFEENSIDYIYHIAAFAAEGLSHFVRKFNYQNNVIGSINLINAAIKHKVKCFIFTSSIAVYGSNHPPFDEKMIPIPNDPYGITKYAIELDLKAANEQFGLNYIIFRPHNVYGERQNIHDPYRNVIGIFINQLQKGEPLSIFGNGEQSRAFTYIGDISGVIANSINIEQAINKVINIGADKTYSINIIAEKVMNEMNLKSEIKFHEARKESIHAFSNHRTAIKIFGEFDKTSLDLGLEIMCKWVRSSDYEYYSPQPEIEITKNLPKKWQK